MRLAPGYGAGSFEANVIATIQQVEKYLFEVSLMPAMALCEDAPRLPALPEVDGQKKLYLLFHPGASGILLTHIDRPTFIVCNAARKTIEIQQLLSRAEMAGVPARQAQGILAEWLEEGALVLCE